MIDNAFCEILEYMISNALANSDDEDLRGFWCDGVELPASDAEYSTRYVNDDRQIIMTAYAGKDGQDRYELVLLFGSKALSQYARGLDIAECIPDGVGWLEVDVVEKKMKVRLL